MTKIAENLQSYGVGIKYKDIPSETVPKVKGLLIDNLACAVDSFSSEPSKIVRKLASLVQPIDIKSTDL